MTNHKTLMAVLAAAALAFSGLAMAKDNDNHGNGHGNKHGNHKPGKRHGPPPHAQNDGRGAGPDHNFYKGGHLPAQYRTKGYWVEDWRGHRLSAPPAGYHWVQTGGDYVLVQNNTGTILQIFLGQ